MDIELMIKQELSAVKGGIWVYWNGEWIWIDETR